MSAKPSDFFLNNAVTTRPGAGNGLWAMFLLPLSLIISVMKHPIIVTPTYKIVSLVSFGLLCTTVVILLQFLKNQRLKVINIWTIINMIVTSVLFNICLHKDWTFCLISGIYSTVIFFKAYIFALNKFKDCFTLGEACLVTQGFIILSYCGFENILNAGRTVSKSYMQISTLIIQVGLLGIIVISYSVYKFKIRSTKSFYFLLIFVLLFVIFLPLQVLINANPVLWIINFILDDMAALKLIIYWSFCTGIAVLAVSNQIFYAKKASPGMRKIFHILAVLVYIPGLLYKCSFLYLASGVVLGIFFALEILRILEMPPLGRALQDGYVVFSDEKDAGILALTPIYLLAGCSLPLWIHPSPCDVTDSAVFSILPLLSGLLSVGMGDTAASFVGSNFGNFQWPGSKKTVEGTIACILSQFALIALLINFGFISHLSQSNYFKIVLAVVVGSLVEARTSQIDNLVLPLIMYIILI